MVDVLCHDVAECVYLYVSVGGIWAGLFRNKFPAKLLTSQIPGRILSLCVASRMWVRHRSFVIVPPEGGLEFLAGLTKKIVFYSCHGQK